MRIHPGQGNTHGKGKIQNDRIIRNFEQ
jgi:hypothetical protein